MGNRILTLEVPEDISDQLERLAQSTQRSPSNLAAEALAAYLDVNEWQVEHIKKALEEAKSGAPGISHERIKAWVRSWGTDKELPKPEP
jgi:predicted transcriptional regulator